jgi:cytochrome P450
MSFWLISHLLCEPKLYNAVREEVFRGCKPDGTVDIQILITECPILDSVWHEVLRLYNAASTAREAQQETTVGGKRVHKGDRILTPFRQFQLDPNLFGPDARTFAPERFLKNKNLHRSKGFHPWGGGTTYCPGRFFAQQEVYMLVALFFYRYDISVVGPSTVPRLDVHTPVPASMRPLDDLQLKIKPRSHTVS